jgi:hypothetical protein
MPESMRIKEEFHHLIDSIEDEQVLKGYYALINNLNNGETGRHWNSLTDEQKEEVLLSYEESFNEENLISHEEVVKSLEKWLKP